MIKKLYLPFLMALIVAFSSCSKMGELSSDYFTTTPQVLEAVGGKVPVTINGKMCIRDRYHTRWCNLLCYLFQSIS